MMNFLMTLIVNLLQDKIIEGLTVEEMKNAIDKENNFDEYFFSHVKYETEEKNGILYVTKIERIS